VITIRNRTAIVGIGNTSFGTTRYPLPDSSRSLACQAIMAAIEDAGLSPKEIDGMMKISMDTSDASGIADALGLNLKFFGRTIWGGHGACTMVAQAAAAVTAGLAKNVICFRSISQSQDMSFGGTGAAFANGVPGLLGWQLPIGLFTAPQAAGIGASRHFHLYGTTRAHLANIALACRKHANQNPNAFFYDKKMTREDYFNSPMVSYPICRFDCCLESDGACAVIVSSAEMAKDLKQCPVYIMAATQGGLSYDCFPQLLVKQVDKWQDENWHAAQQAYRMAGVVPADVDVAQIYDAFSILVLMMLETLGFCRVGEGGPFTENGNLEWPDGGLPLNTSGGALSEAYMHGMNHVIEAVRQLRGISTAQVKDCEIALVSSANVVPSSILILRR
jgi:acetyl-CoA acetyltransferase